MSPERQGDGDEDSDTRRKQRPGISHLCRPCDNTASAVSVPIFTRCSISMPHSNTMAAPFQWEYSTPSRSSRAARETLIWHAPHTGLLRRIVGSPHNRWAKGDNLCRMGMSRFGNPVTRGREESGTRTCVLSYAKRRKRRQQLIMYKSIRG